MQGEEVIKEGARVKKSSRKEAERRGHQVIGKFDEFIEEGGWVKRPSWKEAG